MLLGVNVRSEHRFFPAGPAMMQMAYARNGIGSLALVPWVVAVARCRWASGVFERGR